jgi:hypothetical protein
VIEHDFEEVSQADRRAVLVLNVVCSVVIGVEPARLIYFDKLTSLSFTNALARVESIRALHRRAPRLAY